MITLECVTKRFDDKTVLDQVSLTVKASCVYGIVGFNGSGKSTLLKMMAGVYAADKGQVRVLGEPVFDNARVKRRLFYVPEEFYIQPFASLGSIARFYAGYYPAFRMDTFERLVRLFQLSPAKRIQGFSKGMQRQAELILALSTMPEVLLLDEVFDGLDPQKRSLVRSLLLEYMAETQAAVCISSHNLRELAGLCDHVAFLEDKAFALQGAVEDLLEDTGRFRVIFREPRAREAFDGLQAVQLVCSGKAASFLLTKGKKECYERLRALGATQVDEIPLTLEELFLLRSGPARVDVGHIFE